jgi:hypothetical protein
MRAQSDAEAGGSAGLELAGYLDWPGLLLLQSISWTSVFCDAHNPFDCVSAHAVRSRPLGYRIVAMLEVFTALFGVMSAGIFIAHALDGYRSRP